MAQMKSVPFLLGILMTATASAQVPERTVNFAFATQIGGGIYKVGGRTVQVYRVAGSIQLQSPDGHPFGIMLRFPITIGFFDFKIEDVLATGLPEDVATLALVPELTFEIRVQDTWWLRPFGGLGLGKDFQGGALSVIYVLGVRSIAIWPWHANHIRLANRLIHSGYTNEDIDFVDDFGIFETGVDLRRGLSINVGQHEIDGSVFGINYLYLVSPRLLTETFALDLTTSWEFGVTFGTTTPWRVIGIRMPRVGVSYRFGSGPGTLRIIIGNPFPIDAIDQTGPAVEQPSADGGDGSSRAGCCSTSRPAGGSAARVT